MKGDGLVAGESGGKGQADLKTVGSVLPVSLREVRSVGVARELPCSFCQLHGLCCTSLATGTACCVLCHVLLVHPRLHCGGALFEASACCSCIFRTAVSDTTHVLKLL